MYIDQIINKSCDTLVCILKILHPLSLRSGNEQTEGVCVCGQAYNIHIKDVQYG